MTVERFSADQSTAKGAVINALTQRLDRLKGNAPDSRHIEPETNAIRRKIEFVSHLPEEVAFLLIEQPLIEQPESDITSWSRQERLNNRLGDFVSNKITISYGEQIVIHPLIKHRETSVYPAPDPILMANAVANPSRYEFVSYPDNMWLIRITKQ
jgi:hypothetical protein